MLGAMYMKHPSIYLMKVKRCRESSLSTLRQYAALDLSEKVDTLPERERQISKSTPQFHISTRYICTTL